MLEDDLDRLVNIGECVTHFFFPALEHCMSTERRRRLLASRASVTASDLVTLEDVDEDAVVDEHAKGAFNIVDTVLYSYSKPVGWFYFDRARGIIRRRQKKDLNSRSIVSHFSSCDMSVTGNLAWYLKPESGRKGAKTSTVGPHFSMSGQSSGGPAGLMNFIQLPKEKGVFQLFVDNKGEDGTRMRHEVVVCQYSLTTWLVEKLVSRYFLTDSSIPLKRRLSFSLEDGSHFHHPVCSRTVRDRFLGICQRIAKLFEDYLSYRVEEMVLCFKVGRQDRVYILWCDRLKILNLRNAEGVSYCMTPGGTTRSSIHGAESSFARSRHSLNPVSGSENSRFSYDTASHSMLEYHSPNTASDLTATSTSDPKEASQKQIPNAEELMCPLCHRLHPRASMPRVVKRWLLFSLQLLDQQTDNWEDVLPPSVTIIEPQLSLEEFNEKANDIRWLTESVQLCSGCLDRCVQTANRLHEEKIRVPSWLLVDEQNIRGQKGKPLSTFFDSGGQRKVMTVPQSPVLREPSPHSTLSSSRPLSRAQIKPSFFRTARSPSEISTSIQSTTPSVDSKERPLDEDFSLGCNDLVAVMRRRRRRQNGAPSSQTQSSISSPSNKAVTVWRDGCVSPSSSVRRLSMAKRLTPSHADHPLAADIYSLREVKGKEIMVKVGFGRPEEKQVYTAAVPQEFTSRTLAVHIRRKERTENEKGELEDKDESDPETKECFELDELGEHFIGALQELSEMSELQRNMKYTQECRHRWDSGMELACDAPCTTAA